MRILIAEDEVSIAKALKVMLEKQNYTVDMVHNGNDALDFIMSRRLLPSTSSRTKTGSPIFSFLPLNSIASSTFKSQKNLLIFG